MMTRYLLLIATALLLTSCSGNRMLLGQDSQVSIRPDFIHEPGRVVALLPFAVSGRNGFNYVATERFTANLALAGFSVLDRSIVEQAAGKAGISLSEIPSRSQIAELGKSLGVGIIVAGSCIYRQEAASESEDAIAMISARFMDSASGETLIYANTQPDGIMPITRSLAVAIRNKLLNDLFQKGNSSYNYKNYADAINRFSAIITMEPTMIEAYRNRGAALSKSGDNTKALADYDRALALFEAEEKSRQLFSLPGFLTPMQPEKGELFFNRGIVLVKSEKPAAALSDFNRALAEGVDPAKVYANLGYARFRMKEINNSLIEYDKAIRANPDMAEIYYQRGLVLEDVNVKKAIIDFSKAISLDSRFNLAMAARGRANLRLGYKDDAIRDYTKAIEFDPLNAEYLTGRGAAFFQAGERDKAIRDYSGVIDAHPTYFDAYLGRGVSHAANGDPVSAMKDFDKVLKSGTTIAGGAYLDIGIFKQKQGNYREAIENFSKAIEASGKDGSAYSNRGYALERMGNYHDSVLDYTRAIELKADNPSDFFNRGYSKMQTGGYRQAIDDFSRAANLDPSYAPIFSNRGYAYQNTGNYSQAISDYNRALALMPEKGETSYHHRYPDKQLNQVAEEFHPFFIYYNRGLSYLAAGTYRQAIEDFSKAIEFGPRSAEAFVRRAMANQQLGEMERSLADYNHAIELDSRLAEARFGRGTWYEQSGKFSSAIADFSKAIDIMPDFAQAYFSRGLLKLQMNLLEPGMDDIRTAARMNLKQAKDYLMTRGADW